MNIKNDEGTTALIEAIRDPEIAKLLIEKGANLNIKMDGEGITALMIAIGDEELETVKLLIEEGANLDIQDEYGATALMIAIYGKELEIINLLILKGVDLNIKDNDGDTALDIAKQEFPKIVDLLKNKGAK